MYPSWNARAVGLSLPTEETIEIAADAGFAGVDLLVRDLVESGADPVELRWRMDELGLRGGAWPLPVQWRRGAAQFAEDLRRLPRYARAAATLGLTRTGTWVLPESDPAAMRGADRRDILRQAVAFHLDRLGRIAEVLADHGSRLGLEIMGPASARTGQGVAFVHRYAHLADWLEALRDQHQNVGVLVDAFHLFAAGEEPEAGFVWGEAAMVWVHVADSASSDRSMLLDQQRELPGKTGLGDSRDLLRMLSERGYDGPVTAEPLGQCRSLHGLGALAAARRTMRALRSVWPSRLIDWTTGGSDTAAS